MNIGEAGKKAGLSPDTIRFYEKRGLIVSTKRDEKGHRYYAESDVGWLSLLACLRGTGMPLAETETFTQLAHEGEHTVPDRIDLLKRHRQRLREKREELDRFEEHLDAKIAYYTDIQKEHQRKAKQ